MVRSGSNINQLSQINKEVKETTSRILDDQWEYYPLY